MLTASIALGRPLNSALSMLAQEAANQICGDAITNAVKELYANIASLLVTGETSGDQIIKSGQYADYERQIWDQRGDDVGFAFELIGIGGTIVGGIKFVKDKVLVKPSEKHPSTPTGQSGHPATVKPGTNNPGHIDGISYSGHALDQMQGRGVPSSVVKNTIQYGEKFPTREGTTGYYDNVNNIRVIVNANTGQVVTVIPGAP